MTMSRNIQTPGATPTPPVENQDDQAPPAPAPPPPPAKPAKDAGALTAEQQEIADLKAQNAALQAQVNRKPAAAHAPTSKPAVVSAKSVDAKKIKRAVLTDEGYICPAPPLEPKK
jgi:hypothetical protein